MSFEEMIQAALRFENQDEITDYMLHLALVEPDSEATDWVVKMGRSHKGPQSENLSRKPAYWILRRLWSQTEKITDPPARERLRSLWRRLRTGRRKNDTCWPWELDDSIRAFLCGPAEVARLVERLHNGEPGEKIFSLKALQVLGSEAQEAIPALLEALQDRTVIKERAAGFNVDGYRYTYVRYHAVLALSSVAPYESKAAVMPVIQELSACLSYEDASEGDPFCPADSRVEFSQDVIKRFQGLTA